MKYINKNYILFQFENYEINILIKALEIYTSPFISNNNSEYIKTISHTFVYYNLIKAFKKEKNNVK